MAISDMIGNITTTVTGWYASIFGTYSMEVPKEGESTVGDFVTSIWQESQDWRKKSFDGRLNYFDPVLFWKDCRLLEEGLHWEVWGRRNTGDDDKWKHEIVDDEISNQVRVRKSYLTANWHDVTVVPNIKDSTAILDQERENTDWGDLIIQVTQRGLTEGMAVVHTVFDRTEDVDGLVKEKLIDNESLFPTPFSTGIRKCDGCWYLAVGELMTEQMIREYWNPPEDMAFESANMEIARYFSIDRARNQVNWTGKHTRLIPVVTLWMDDPLVVRDRVTELDTQEAEAENAAVWESVPIEVSDEQNHIEHIERHMAWLNTLSASGAETEAEVTLVNSIVEYMFIHMQEHYKAINRKVSRGLSPGQQFKYPYGRKIVIASGNVLEDGPNPHEVPWRSLFHVWYNEKLPYSWWGRGVPEILWNTNKTEDTMLSRTADIALSVGMPKLFFSKEDKDDITEQGYDNDPTKPLFTTTPPGLRQGSAPRENLEIYNAMKANASKTQGVSGVSYGQAPTSSASGKLTELLLAQNQIVVTGEANQRLSASIAAIVEMRIEFWKKYYTEPRWYFIDGWPVALTLSEYFSTYTTRDGKEKKVPKFQVTVRPNSNFPSRFEFELSFLLQLAQTPSPDGTPFVTRETILDTLSEMYPKLGRNTENYQMSEALKRGMEAIAVEQERDNQERKTLRNVAGKFINRGIKEVMGDTNTLSEPPETAEPTSEVPTFNNTPVEGIP